MPSRLTSRAAAYARQRQNAQAAWAKVAAATAQTAAQNASAIAINTVEGDLSGGSTSTIKTLEDRLDAAGIA